ncbi:MAG: AMP-binding protein [Actinomycetota bacterium]
MTELGIAAHARRNPWKTAISDGDRQVSFGELHGRSCRAAHLLRGLGIGPEQRLAVALPNCPEFFEVSAAAAMLGAEVVPISWRATADELGYLVGDSGATVLVAESDRDVAAAVLSLDEYERLLVAEPDTPPQDSLDPAPTFYRAYTSGTTGRPKAVDRPHPTVERYLQSMLRYPLLQGLTDPGEVHLACGPVYHTAPRAFAAYALLLGQSVVLMRHFDAKECLRLIERHRVTWTHMVPINFVRILALPNARDFDLSSVKRVLHAAAPCPVDVKRRVMDLFPRNTVWEYYGMTEGLATMISPSEWLRKPGSVGRAAPDLEVHILDDEGREVPRGEVGLVYVPPMAGVRFSYAGAPEKTAEIWRGDLYTVGDMGYVDEDGYLFLVDRKQDLIISGGTNIYPAEVEAVLYGHPAVGDVVVIGVPDPEWGEQVKAIVEKRADVTELELIEFCRERLAHDKCPKSVDFVEQLPRDPNGKVRKRELRDRYWDAAGRKI